MSHASPVVERLDIQTIAHGHRDPAPQNRDSSGATFLGLGQNLRLEVIDPAAEKLLHGNLAPLVEGGVHYSTGERLDHSWLAPHPRLTCEALFQATMMLEPIIAYRMPETEDLSELQEWARDFQDVFPEWLDEGYDGQG